MICTFITHHVNGDGVFTNGFLARCSAVCYSVFILVLSCWLFQPSAPYGGTRTCTQQLRVRFEIFYRSTTADLSSLSVLLLLAESMKSVGFCFADLQCMLARWRSVGQSGLTLAWLYVQQSGKVRARVRVRTED